MARVYSYYDGCDESAFVTRSKAAAIKRAQEAADDLQTDQQVYVQDVTVNLATLISAINREGWASNVSVIHVCKPRKTAP